MSERLLRWLDAHLFLMLALIFLLRGGFLLSNGDLGLIGDESYYWDWSRQPAWCYYSKPPLVAWLIGLSSWLFGDNVAAVRLPALLLGTVFLGYFHATTKAFYGRQAAALALVMMLATPDNVIANLIMTIDPPLYCFWIMTLYYLHKALFQQQDRAWWWAGCASAAAVLSKQAGLILPAMLLLFLLLQKSRHVYLKRQFWFYLLPVLLALLPIVLWNQQHDWVMFGHSKSHFSAQQALTAAAVWKYTGSFWLYQILLMSPVIFVLSLICSVKAVFGYRRLSNQAQLLTLMGPLPLLLVLILGFQQKVQGNWPMPFYFSALILLAAEWRPERWRRTLKYGLGLAYLMVAITYLLPGVMQALNLQNSKWDPTRRFKYWQDLAVNVQQQRLAILPSLEHSFVVVMGHRNMASELAFYLPDHPKVYRYQADGGVASQYDIWPGPLEFIGANAVILTANLAEPPLEIKQAFKHFRFVGQVANIKNPQAPYALYLGENLTDWPVAARQLSLEE